MINCKDQNWFSLHKLGIGKWTSLKRVHQVLWWKGSACLHHGLLLKCTPPIEYLLQYLPHPHLLQQSIPIPLINLVFSNPLDLPQCLQSPLHDWTFYHLIVALIGTLFSLLVGYKYSLLLSRVSVRLQKFCIFETFWKYKCQQPNIFPEVFAYKTNVVSILNNWTKT